MGKTSDICPICGGVLGKEIWLNNPPNRGKKCTKCGRVDEIPREEITIHPRNGYKGSVYPFKRK